ncbi:FtsX-like permease family protein, partial [Bacteroidota bacterium]
EDYWTRYKGTPKAYIPLSEATKRWSNRFGIYTSFRYSMNELSTEQLSMVLLESLEPAELGFEFRPIYQEASYAAENGVDFSELFGGLSIFLLAGAIILSVLLFRLNLEDRKKQIATLSSMGIPFQKIRRIMAMESIMVARFGALLGIGLAVLYTKMIFMGLNGIWMDIVRTNMLSVNFRVFTLLIGYIGSLVIAWIVIYAVLNRFLKRVVYRHLPSRREATSIRINRYVPWLAALSGISALSLIILQFLRNEVVNASVFFAAGGLLLVSGILFIHTYLLKLRNRTTEFGLWAVSIKSAVFNMPRSMSIVILLSLGTFIVLSTGSNRKDLFADADKKESGTGGFLYYAESTVPVLRNLNNSDVRYDYGISDEIEFIQMRLADGDDASCLNLNMITAPAILGLNPSALTGRFSFVTSLPLLDPLDPWETLSVDIGEDVIPAIADETVIKWGLGKRVGDTLVYQDAKGEEMKLLLVGGLAPSIFQGKVLISEANFLKHFPTSSGSSVFLVNGQQNNAPEIEAELSRGFRDMGWTMEYTPARLAEFNSITNTYLSIFMILGALGLLLGTVAIAIVMLRSLMERRAELALFKALGYENRRIRRLIVREYLSLLIGGTGVGGIAAVVATLPSFISRNSDASFTLVLAIIILLLINGYVWIQIMTFLSMKNKSLHEVLRNE